MWNNFLYSFCIKKSHILRKDYILRGTLCMHRLRFRHWQKVKKMKNNTIEISVLLHFSFKLSKFCKILFILPRKSWQLLDFWARNLSKVLPKKLKKSKILTRDKGNLRFWQEMQNVKFYLILAKQTALKSASFAEQFVHLNPSRPDEPPMYSTKLTSLILIKIEFNFNSIWNETWLAN